MDSAEVFVLFRLICEREDGSVGQLAGGTQRRALDLASLMADLGATWTVGRKQHPGGAYHGQKWLGDAVLP